MKIARTLDVALLEFKTILKLPVFWILILVALMLTMSFNPAGFVPSGQVANSGLKLYINSKYVMAQYFAFSGLIIFSFLGSIIAGMSVIRDAESKGAQIIHSTPLTAFEYITGKFLGVMAALVMALVIQSFMAYVVYEIRPLSDPLIVVGPFNLANYIMPALIFALPGITFFAATAFAFGVWTRKPMVVYAVPAVLFISIMRYCVVPTADAVGPQMHTLLTYLDPSGLRWLIHSVFALDKGIEFYNTSPFVFEPAFLINRYLLIAVVVVFLIGSAVYMKGWLRKGGVSKPWFRFRKRASATDKVASVLASEGLRNLNMKTSRPRALGGIVQMLRSELLELSRQPIFYLFVLFILGLTSESAIESGQGILGASSFLTSGSIAVASLDVLSVLMCMLLLFYTIEVMQRDHSTGFAMLLFSSPVSTVGILLSRLLSNLVLSALVIAMAIASALMLLLAQGPSFVEIGTFILIWGALLGTTLVLWTCFVLAVFSISRSRYTTYAIGMLALGISTYCHVQGLMTWAYNWDLLGTLRWSDMGLFALNGEALLFNRLWALSLAVFLFALSIQFFSRTEPDPMMSAQRRKPKQVLYTCLRLAPFALLPLILSGYTSYQVNQGFQGEVARERAKAYWSKNLATWRDYTPASVTFVDVDIDLAPANRSMSITGSFTLVNETRDKMELLPFTIGQSFDSVRWTVADIVVEAEDRSDLHLLHMDEALLPGDSVIVGFSYEAIYPKGFTRNGGGLRHFILPSGVLISTLRGEFLPLPGFDERRGIYKENYYESVDFSDELHHLEKEGISRSSFHSRLKIAAPSAYTVTATGIKTDETEEEGMTVVTWETAVPVTVLNVMAGKWDVQSTYVAEVGDTLGVGEDNTAVYYHPAHAYNVEDIMDALVAARRQYSEWFYPYPWGDLRINEFPNLDQNATGFPINISFSEGVGFLTKPERGAHLPFVVTAHEVAHQWWGHILSPAEGYGADFLIEGMANYSSLLLLESEKGDAARRTFSRYMEQQYVRSRRIDSETPLILNKAEDNQGESIAYNKGAWVMWMLRSELGEEQMMESLKFFVTQHALKDDALPDLKGLIHIFRSAAADSNAFAQFEEQWINNVVLPEFRLKHVEINQVGTQWEIQATIENVGSGVVDIEVAAVETMPDLERGVLDYGGQAVVEKLHLTPGNSVTFEIETSFEPEGLVVDPHIMMLQVNREKAMFVFEGVSSLQ